MSSPQPSKYWVGECAKQVYVVSAKIPAFADEPKLAERMYDLEISWSGNSDKQPHSVKVIDRFKSDYRYVVLADLHTGDPRPFTEDRSPDDFQDTWGKYWSLDMQLQAINEINMINPEFVLCCGDQVLGQMFPNEYGAGVSFPYEAGNGYNYTLGDEYRIFYELALKFEVPVFFVVDNHDGYVQGTDDGLEYWKAMIGPLYYSFDYGTTRYVALNTYDWTQLDRQGASVGVSAWGGQVREQEMQWLDKELASAKAAGAGIVCFGHHSPHWPEDQWYGKNYTDGVPAAEQIDRALETVAQGQRWTGEGRDAMLALCKKYGVSIFYAGHIHCDEVNITDWGGYETRFIVTTAAASDTSTYRGYRYVHVINGTIADYTYGLTPEERQQYFGDANARIGEDIFSIPLYKLNSYRNETDTKEGRKSIAVEIDNRLNQDFKGIKLRVPALESANGWKVGGDFNGSIGNVLGSSGRYEVEMLVDVPAHSRGIVYLAEQDESKSSVSGKLIPGFEAILAGVALVFAFFLFKARCK